MSPPAPPSSSPSPPPPPPSPPSSGPPDHPTEEQRPFWVGVAMTLSITVVVLFAAFFAIRVLVPWLMG